jgi:phage-related minor tail protein
MIVTLSIQEEETARPLNTIDHQNEHNTKQTEMMRSRALDIDRKIRESEIFPRIRDAEKAMYEDEGRFIKRREKKRKKREKQLKESNFSPLPKIKSLSPKKPAEDYFSGFVLNKDPGCSKYMPFNEVFFPKLFTNSENAHDPHSLDLVWMLGFQHDDIHKHSGSVELSMKKEFK